MVDPDFDIEVIYDDVIASGMLDGGTGAQWLFTSVPFEPEFDTFGVELLNVLQVGRPIGMPANGFLAILGEVLSSDSDDTNDVLRAAAVVDTAQTATCQIQLNP